MDSIEIKKEEQTENQNQDRDKNRNTETENREQTEMIAKVSITKKAENLVSGLVARVNDGFEFGRVNRHQLMSWILSKFAEECTEQDIRAIRADHFDEIALIEISLRKFKQAGGLPPEVRKALLAQSGYDETGRKSGKKAS